MVRGERTINQILIWSKQVSTLGQSASVILETLQIICNSNYL